MPTFDYVLASPSLGPGVSIDTPFDIAFMYGLAAETTAGVRYMRQMVHRARTIVSRAVFVKISYLK